MIQMPISNWEMTSQIPKNTVDQTPNGPLVPLLLSTPAPQTVGSACQSPTQKPWSIPRKWKPNDRAPWGLKLGNIKGKICILYMYMYIESRKIHQRRPQIAKDILGEQPKAVSWQQHQHPGSKARSGNSSYTSSKNPNSSRYLGNRIYSIHSHLLSILWPLNVTTSQNWVPKALTAF